MISQQTIKTTELSQHCGKITQYEIVHNGMVGSTEHAFFKISVVQDGIIKIHLSQNEELDEHSYAVISKPSGIDFSTADKNDLLELHTEKLSVILKKEPFTVIFKDKAGEIINEDDHALGTSWIGEQVTTYKKLQEGERFVGLGRENRSAR